MAVITYPAGACPALLVAQSAIMRENDPSNLIERVGLLQALFDPNNRPTATFEEIRDREGKVKQMRIWSRKPTVASDATDEKDCTGGESDPVFEDTVTISLHSQWKGRLTENEMRTLCDALNAYNSIPGAQRSSNNTALSALLQMQGVYSSVAAGFPAMRAHMNQQLWTIAPTAFGTFRDGTALKTFTFLKSDHSPLLKGFNQLQQELNRSTMSGRPIIVGEGVIELANMTLNYGCCNDGGTDFGKMANSAAKWQFYADVDAPVALADADEALVFMPGTMHLIDAENYVGTFAGQFGTMYRGTIADPAVPGLTYDLRIMPNECGEYYDVYLNKDYDLWYAEDLFKGESEVDAGDGDPREGINGIFNIKGAAAA